MELHKIKMSKEQYNKLVFGERLLFINKSEHDIRIGDLVTPLVEDDTYADEYHDTMALFGTSAVYENAIMHEPWYAIQLTEVEPK